MLKIRICDADAVEEETILKVSLDGRPAVSATRVEGKVYVFPDTCPHAEQSLAGQGWVEDGRVVCGVHFAEFDLGTGEAHEAPSGCPNMTFYKAEERDGAVFAELD